MVLSQSSTTDADPLSDVLTVLGARIMRPTRLEASGRWALGWPAFERLKFVAVLKGTAWLISPGREPDRLDAGDVCLIGRTPYVVASDPDVPVMAGEALYADGDVARLGGDDVILLGGAVTFSSRTAEFLMDMLPDFLVAPRSSSTSGVVTMVLGLLGAEAERGAIGTTIVSARLADILLVEAIRAYAADQRGVRTSWLGALADPRLGRALQAMHGKSPPRGRWSVLPLSPGCRERPSRKPSPAVLASLPSRI